MLSPHTRRDIHTLLHLGFAEWVLLIFCLYVLGMLCLLAWIENTWKRILPLLLTASLAGCMATTKQITVAQDSKGRPVPVPAFASGGDLVGEVEFRIDGFGNSLTKITAPETTEFPVMYVARLDRKGMTLLGYDQIPLYPGIYHGRVNEGLLGGWAKIWRSISNLAGTILSGWMGIEVARSPGQAFVPQSQ